MKEIEPDKLKYSINVLERAIRINYSRRSRAKFKHCKLLINPMELVNYGLLDVGKIEEIYQIGYRCAHEVLEDFDDLSLFQATIKD